MPEIPVIREFVGHYAFLSNFAISRIIYRGLPYDGVEWLYQTLKSEDPRERDWVRTAPTPGEAKKRGRRVNIRPDWEEIKIPVMALCLRLKFSASGPFGPLLIETFPAKLQEGNWWGDKFWGIDTKTGEGLNMLGQLLEIERAAIMEAY